MPCCTAPRCGNNSSTTKGIAFHSYPLSRPHMVQRWLQCLQAQGKKKEWKPNHWSKVCGCHFEDRFILRLSQVRLTDDAIPTIFDPISESKTKFKTCVTLQDNQLLTKNWKEDLSTKVLDQNLDLMNEKYKHMKVHTSERVPKLIALDSPELLSAREELLIQRSNHTESFANNFHQSLNSASDNQITDLPAYDFVMQIDSKTNEGATLYNFNEKDNKLFFTDNQKELRRQDEKSLSAMGLSAYQLNTNVVSTLPEDSSYVETQMSIIPSSTINICNMDSHRSENYFRGQNVVSDIARQTKIHNLQNINKIQCHKTRTNIIHTSYQIPYNFPHISPLTPISSQDSTDRKICVQQTKTLEVYSKSTIISKVECNEFYSKTNLNETKSYVEIDLMEPCTNSSNFALKAQESSIKLIKNNTNQSFANHRKDIIKKLRNRELLGCSYRKSTLYFKRQYNRSKPNLAKYKETSLSSNVKEQYNLQKTHQIQYQSTSRAHIENLFQRQMKGRHHIFGRERSLRFRKHQCPPYYVHFPQNLLCNTYTAINLHKHDTNNTMRTQNYKSGGDKYYISPKINLFENISKIKKKSNESNYIKQVEAPIMHRDEKEKHSETKYLYPNPKLETNSKLDKNNDKLEIGNSSIYNPNTECTEFIGHKEEKNSHTTQNIKVGKKTSFGNDFEQEQIKTISETKKLEYIKIAPKDIVGDEICGDLEKLSKASYIDTESLQSTNLTHQNESILKALLSKISNYKTCNSNFKEGNSLNKDFTSLTLPKQKEEVRKDNDSLEERSIDVCTKVYPNIISFNKLETGKYKTANETLGIQNSAGNKNIEQCRIDNNSKAPPLELLLRTTFHEIINLEQTSIKNIKEYEQTNHSDFNKNPLVSQKKLKTLEESNIINSDISKHAAQNENNIEHPSNEIIRIDSQAVRPEFTVKSIVENKNSISINNVFTQLKDNNTDFLTKNTFNKCQVTDDMDLKYVTDLSRMESNNENSYVAEEILQVDINGRWREYNTNEDEDLQLLRVYSPDATLIRKAYSENCVFVKPFTKNLDKTSTSDRKEDCKKLRRTQSQPDVRSHDGKNEAGMTTVEAEISNCNFKTENTVENKSIPCFTSKKRNRKNMNSNMNNNNIIDNSREEKIQGCMYTSDFDFDDSPLAYRVKSKYRRCREKTNGYIINSDCSSDDEFYNTLEKCRRYKKKRIDDEDYKPSTNRACTLRCDIVRRRSKRNLSALSIPPFSTQQLDTQESKLRELLEEDAEKTGVKQRSGDKTEEQNDNFTVAGNEANDKRNEHLKSNQTEDKSNPRRYKRRKSMSDQVAEKKMPRRNTRSKSQPPSIDRRCQQIEIQEVPRDSSRYKRRKSTSDQYAKKNLLRRRPRSKSQPPSNDKRWHQKSYTLNEEDVDVALKALCTMPDTTNDFHENNKENTTYISSLRVEDAPKVNLKRKLNVINKMDMNQNVSKKIKNICNALSAENLLKNLKYKLHCLIWIILKMMLSNKTFSHRVVHGAGFGDAYIQYINSSNVKQKLFLFPRYRSSNEALVFESFFPIDNSISLFNLKELYQTFKEIIPDDNTNFILLTNAKIHDSLLRSNFIEQQKHDIFDAKSYKVNPNDNQSILDCLINDDITEENTARQFLSNLQILDEIKIDEHFVTTKLGSMHSNFDAKKTYQNLLDWAERWLKNKTGKIDEFEDLLFQCKCNKQQENLIKASNLNCNFVGRNCELNILKETFNSTSSQLTVVMGLPGIGKTELVIKFINIHRDELQNIVWLNGPTLKQDIKSTACSLGIKQCNEYYHALLGLCNFLKDKRFALVLDNMDGLCSVPQEILQFLNLQNKSQLIIATSRNPNWNEVKTIHLESIEKEESIKLLTELLKMNDHDISTDTKDLLEQVFDITSGVPIALHLAAASIRAGAEAFNILGQSTSIGRSLRTCLARIRKLSPIMLGYFEIYPKSVVVFFEHARKNAVTEHHENLALTMLEILASVGDVCVPLRSFLPIVRFSKALNSQDNQDQSMEFEEECELLLARAAKILVSHGLLQISNDMAKLSHSIIQELTTAVLSMEGRQAQILNYALLLSQTKINDIPSFTPPPNKLWNLALSHLELLIKHHKTYLDFLESSTEDENTYKSMATKILALGSYQPRVLTANLWSRLRVARCLWNKGKIEEGEKSYGEVVKDITTSIDLQDAFFMRSYRLVCRINALTNVEVAKEVEELLIYSVPMCLSEPRHLRYTFILAQALGRIGRNYQAWELYEVIWKHISHVDENKLQGGPSMCDVMASAAPLAWSKLPENKILSTFMSCMEETEIKKKIKVLKNYATWAYTIENVSTKGRAVEMFNQVLQQSYSCKDSFEYLFELWEDLSRQNLSYAAALVLEATTKLPNILPWQKKFVLGIQRISSYNNKVDFQSPDDFVTGIIKYCSNLPNWSYLLEQLYFKAYINSEYLFCILILEKIWELTIISPTFRHVSMLPNTFRRIFEVAGKLLDSGRPQNACTIFSSLSAKMQFLVQNGMENLSELLTLLSKFEELEQSKSTVKIEMLKIDLERLVINSNENFYKSQEKMKVDIRVEDENHFQHLGVLMDNEDLNNKEIILRSSVESLKICDQELNSHSNDNSIHYCDLLYNKASILLSLGYLEAAFNICNEVLSKLHQMLENDHQNILRAMFLKASILEAMYKYEDALQEYMILYDKQTCILGPENCESIRTKTRTAFVYECKGQSEKAIQILDDLLLKQKSHLGIKHSSTLAIMFDKACLLQKQLKYRESVDILNDLIKIRSEKYGVGHIDTLRTKQKLATVLSQLGEFKMALQLFTDLIPEQIKQFGKNNPITINSLNDYAQVYLSKQEYTKALETFENVLAEKIITQGLEHPSTILTMEAIARTLIKMDNFTRALEIYDKILSTTKCMHFSIRIGALSGKACIYEKLGNLDEALAILIKIKAQQDKLIDSDHKSCLVLTEKIALIYAKKGEYKQSISLYSNILEKSRFLYGSHHKWTQNVIYNLATVFTQSGDYDEALVLFGELLLLEREAKTADVDKYLLAKKKIAMILECKKDFVKSQQICEEILATKQNILPGDDLTTIASLCRLGSLLQKQNKFEEAKSISEKLLTFQTDELHDACYGPYFYSSGHFARSLSLFEKSLHEKKLRLGDVHPSTIATMEAKAAALAGCKRKDEALKLLNEVFLLRSQLFGEFDPSTLNTKSRIATILSEQQVMVPALEMFEEVLNEQENVLGKNHPDTITTTLNRNTVLEMQKEFDAALSSYEKLLVQRKAQLRLGHKDIINIEMKISKLYVKKGDFDKALISYNELIEKINNIYGNSHDLTLKAIFKKSCALEKKGNFDEAINELFNLLKKHNERANPNHCEIFNIKSKISILHTKLGHIDRGLLAIDEVIEEKKMLYGCYHSDTISSFILRTELLQQSKKFNEASLEYKKLLDLLLNKYGDKHKLTLLVRGKFAMLMQQTGNLNTCLETLLHLRNQQREIFGSDHPETLISEYYISIILHRQGKCVESVKQLCNVTKLGAARLGDRHHIIISAKQQLVIVLSESGEFKQALELYNELKGLGLKAIPISLKRSVAFALESTGHLAESIMTYEQILKHTEEEFGTTHSSTLALKSKIALILENNGEIDKSLKYQKEVLEVCRRRFPSNHATTLALTHNHATTLLMNSEDLRHSLHKYKRNLKKEIADLGEDHSNTLLTRNGIALVHAKQGSFSKAKATLQNVLALQRKLLANDHPDVLNTRHNLATVFEMQGDKEEALKQFQEILTSRRLKLGPTHQQTLLTQARVAALCEKLNNGNGKEALEKVLKEQREYLGPIHNDTLATLHVLIHAYEHRKAYKQAFTICEELVSAYAKKSKGSADHFSAMHHSVWMLEKLKEFAKAAQRCQNLWQLRKDSRGELDETTLATRAHLASIYAHQKKLNAACKIYREVLAHQEETLGKEHPQSLVTLHNLIHVLQRQKCNFKEVQRLAHSLKLRRKKAQKSRQENSLLRPCLISETERMQKELAAVQIETKKPLFPKAIPHIPI